jgi:hypothetical protein
MFENLSRDDLIKIVECDLEVAAARLKLVCSAAAPNARSLRLNDAREAVTLMMRRAASELDALTEW